MSKYQHKVSVEGDFKEMVRAAQEASSKMGKMLDAAFRVKGGARRFNEIQKLNEKLIRREEKLRLSMDERVYRQRAIEQGRDADERIRLEGEVERKKRKLREDSLKGEEKDREEMELRLAERRLALFQESADSFTRGLRASYKELDGVVDELHRAEKNLSRTVHLYDRSAKASEKMRSALIGEMLEGGEEFADRMDDLFSHIGDKLTGSIDPAAIAKTVGAGVGKGFARMGDLLGPKIGKGGALAFGAVGGLVTILGSLVGVLLDTDKKMKEFNRSAIQTHGSLSLASLGGKNLSRGLGILYNSVNDLTDNFGVSEQDATALFDTLDKGGFTLSRITSGVRSAAAAQEELTNQISDLYRVASASGVGLSEYAQNLTDYVNDLGQSLDTVNDSFGAIADMANRSAFGTRRFYSMVVQATSGQASLNTRLEDTAGLLMKMTKVLGAKKATELAGQHSSDLQGLSTQDRHQLIMTTGAGRFRRGLTRDAAQQARSFSRDAAGSEHLGGALDEARVGQGIRDAITAAGGSSADPNATRNLVSQLAALSRGQQDTLVASLTSRDDGLGRRLGQLVTLARGTNGGLAQMSDAMSGMSAGGSIVARLQSAMAIVGRPLNELTGVERMVAERTTGTSGEQFEMLQKIASNAEGQFRILQSRRGQSMTEEERADLAKRFGATVDANNRIRMARVSEDGKRIESYGEEVTESNQMITAYMERTGDQMENVRTEQAALMNDTYNATVSIQDILENKMLYYVQGLYEDVGMPILDAVGKILGGSKSTITTSSEIRKRVSSAVKVQQDVLSDRSRLLQLKKTQRDSATGADRARLTKEIQELEAGVATARANIDRERAAGAAALANVGHAGAQGHRYTYDTPGGPTSAATWEEAVVGARNFGTEGSARAVELTADELLNRARAGIPAPARATGAALVGFPARAGAAATAAPAAAPVAPPPAPSNVDVNPVATAATVGVVRDTTQHAEANLAAETSQIRDQADRHQQEGQRFIKQVLTRETKLGDALARSNLPDAIAQAQLKLQFQQMAYAAGLNSEEVARATAEFMGQGTVSTDFQKRILATGDASLAGNMHLFGIRANELGGATGRRFGSATSPAAGAAASGDDPTPRGGDGDSPAPLVRRPHHDFIYQNRGGAPTITPIDREDQVVGARPGGVIDRAAGGRAAGSVVVNIYGGDQRRTYETVRRVLRESGIAPNRMPTSG